MCVIYRKYANGLARYVYILCVNMYFQSGGFKRYAIGPKNTKLWLLIKKDLKMTHAHLSSDRQKHRWPEWPVLSIEFLNVKFNGLNLIIKNCQKKFMIFLLILSLAIFIFSYYQKCFEYFFFFWGGGGG